MLLPNDCYGYRLPNLFIFFTRSSCRGNDGANGWTRRGFASRRVVILPIATNSVPTEMTATYI